MNTSMAVIWLIIFAVLLVVEIITMGLTTIWFAGGAVLACICAALKLPLWVQITVFVLSSGALLYFTRPVAIKYFNKNRTRTNVDSMVGKTAVVSTEIDNIQGTGQVKVDGMEWSARSLDNAVIEVGKVVVVKNVQGVKLIVAE